jgi:FkbM family methyltransferase
MEPRIRRSSLSLALWAARALPVGILRSANQRLHGSRLGRHLLNRIWTAVGDQPTVVPGGALAGWRFASGGGQPAYLLGVSEPDVQRALERHVRAGDVVYDIGANVGFFALLAARLSTPGGHVYAFEPMEPNVRALRRNLELNAVDHATVVQAAVSDRCGRAHMSPGNNQATGHLAEQGPGLMTVEATTIDTFVAAGHRPPTLLKIDVEGAEDRVLRGMRDTLLEHRPVILCELHHDVIDPRRAAITSLLDVAGYDEHLVEDPGGSMPHLLALPRDMRSSAIGA